MTDRLPLPATLTPEQQSARAAIVQGPRGELVGPFVPLLRAPELMTRVQMLGEHLRFGGTADPRLTELVILLVSRHWDQDFEWGYHAPLARAAGLGDVVIESIAAGLPVAAPTDARAVAALVNELQHEHQVSDPTWAAAVASVGDVAVVELVATCGYYTTLAMTMNAARTPVPPSFERLPRAAGAS